MLTTRQALLVSTVLSLISLALSTDSPIDARSSFSPGLANSGREWVWPAADFDMHYSYSAPAHEYAPGHRGVDLELRGDNAVVSPADGKVAFSGMVADRPVLTISHGDGLVSTLEPVSSTLVSGTYVNAGTVVGVLSTGGHAAEGTLHFGVREDGSYINPLSLFSDIPRAVLLPCC
ncbi:murein DD-endopeptidase MepM/ murein hydrolase activator NlpD [Microbacterium endophyticum]|uniref:Murein DD-endopeptidase MepM/ murein hydrolase activator NlpD n=1 Tax=Microbacterium endophyticum TaxID=1526412 RepID=A0A7W4YM14_9MICO|nr:M23 family metallopeptidase [Microbacterium endophyticum]MBB2974617.1 murein DD-endopeptidase MepM/ murein hydrolase activator NlpD [Microbacterium endophyticum]NIK36914.1 murein DD-endopeptidase MepM/ murein hydrolase activator NlpD [Microbacterium endophyticum]